jgi:aminopeptidase C
VEYQDGFIELYDLIADPYEMENIAATADQAILERLSAWLKALSTCTGGQCRELDQSVSK